MSKNMAEFFRKKPFQDKLLVTALPKRKKMEKKKKMKLTLFIAPDTYFYLDCFLYMNFTFFRIFFYYIG